MTLSGPTKASLPSCVSGLHVVPVAHEASITSCSETSIACSGPQAGAPGSARECRSGAGILDDARPNAPQTPSSRQQIRVVAGRRFDQLETADALPSHLPDKRGRNALRQSAADGDHLAVAYQACRFLQ